MSKPWRSQLRTPTKAMRFALWMKTKNRSFSQPIRVLQKMSELSQDAPILFVLECSFVKNKPVEKHLELAEAIHLIRYAEPKKAMLTHFYPEWDEVDFQEEVEKFLPNIEIIEAKDGLRVEI